MFVFDPFTRATATERCYDDSVTRRGNDFPRKETRRTTTNYNKQQTITNKQTITNNYNKQQTITNNKLLQTTTITNNKLLQTTNYYKQL